MRHLVGLVGAVVALASLSGCSSSHTRSPDEVFRAMNRELAQTIDEPPVSTTTITSDVILVSSPAAAAAPLPEMPLPESRMSLAELTEPAAQTWGTPPPPAPSVADLSATRE